MDTAKRHKPLPSKMQGRWVDEDNPCSELNITGSEIRCFGDVVVYDYMEINECDGALMVSLKIDDQTNEDKFQRANITNLVITPQGEFYAFNVKFACRFVRAVS